jgi:hypothetical protein
VLAVLAAMRPVKVVLAAVVILAVERHLLQVALD